VLGYFGFRTERGRYAVFGYSGGAMAAAFTAEMAASYAPDLKLAAVVLGGTSPNITTAGYLMNGKDTAGLVVASLIGITSQRNETRRFLVDHLRTEGPYNATAFLAARAMSGVQALKAYGLQNVFDYFVNGRADFDNRALQWVLDEDGAMGYHGTPNMPVFLYKAVQDEMSPVNETDDLVAKYCGGGGNILYHRNALGGHNIELWMGWPRVRKYLSSVLDGDVDAIERPAAGCLTVDVAIPLNLTEVLGPGWNQTSTSTSTLVSTATASTSTGTATAPATASATPTAGLAVLEHT
jgi:hypothetical protein